MNEFITKLIKPLLDDAYNKGYSAGVSAEKLVKEKEAEQREYDALLRGKDLGKMELLAEMDSEIEEISADDFDELAATISEPEPFGFVGTIDDLSLILEGAE